MVRYLVPHKGSVGGDVTKGGRLCSLAAMGSFAGLLQGESYPETGIDQKSTCLLPAVANGAPPIIIAPLSVGGRSRIIFLIDRPGWERLSY
jgi:hypothetical protein